MTLLNKAHQFAEEKHKGQRYNNGPFMHHPLQVYEVIKLLLPKDENLLCAALLHDTLEDTKTTYTELRKEFNEDIADLVREVTKSEYNKFPYLKSVRGIILKFSDRVTNLSNMSIWDTDKQAKYIKKSIFWLQ